MYILNRCKYIYIINICKVFNKLFFIYAIKYKNMHY